MIKNLIVTMLLFGLCSITSCGGQKQEQYQNYYLKKANQFLDKYLPAIESYRETLYKDYFIKLTPDDYGGRYELYRDTNRSCAGQIALKKYINFDSVLLAKVPLSESLIYQRIEYIREDTTQFRGVQISKKDNITRTRRVDFIPWISNNNGRNVCELNLKYYNEFQDFEELFAHHIGSILVMFLRDIKSGDDMIYFNIIENHNNKKYPIRLGFLLREKVNSTQ